MSVVCINTNLSSFRKLAQEMNVSTLTLHDALSIWWNIKEQTTEPTQEDLWSIISPKEVIVPNQAIMEQCELGDISNLIHIIRNIIGDSKGVTLEKLQEELAVPITVEELQQAIPTLITWKDSNNVVHINVGDPVLSYENELQFILDSAPRDEQGRLLAPNGKPSNLTERQYAQVRTKAFIDWFGDWEKFANVSEELLEQAILVFERNPELAKIGTAREYAAYLQEVFPNSLDKSIYWHGSDSDFSQGFASATKGKGSGSPHITDEFYLAKQAWTVLLYVSGVNRTFGPDVNGFNHWNKLWWELKEIMSNGRRENNDWKDLIIGPDNVRQAIPNKKGIFNRDSGGENGKWLKERKADYGYQDKTDAEFFKDVFGIEYGKDTFNTWTLRNAEIFKSLVKTEKGIYPAVINATNPIRESGKNTYYEPERGLLTQARTKGNDAILGANTDNEFNSDVAVVFNALKNVHFLGTTQDIESFKQWLENNRASKVVDENGEPMVVYHTGSGWLNIDIFKTTQEITISQDEEWVTNKDLSDYKKEGYNITSTQEAAYLNGESIVISRPNAPYFASNIKVSKTYGASHVFEKDGLFVGKTYPVFLNIKNAEIINGNNAFWNNIQHKNKFVTTRDLETIYRNKTEGLIIKNIYDVGSNILDGEAVIFDKEWLSDVFIVYNPNQIKSATDNIGTFSRESDNIYHHKSNIQAAINVIERTKELLVKTATVEEANKIVFTTNQRLGELISPEIQIARGYSGLRKKKTKKLQLLESIAELEQPASSDELNQLFNLLRRKFNRNFIIKKTSLQDIRKRRGENVSCFIELINNDYVVWVAENQYPSYTMLAEEMLHPLMYEIQKRNPQLFKQFLEECLNTKNKTIKVLVDSIIRAYEKEEKEVLDNEIVTQVLAYQLKNIKQEQSSTFKKVIANIVKWLNEKGIFNGTRKNFNLRTFAYCLKFENVKFELTQELKQSGYNHIVNQSIEITESVKDLITQTPVWYDLSGSLLFSTEMLTQMLTDFHKIDDINTDKKTIPYGIYKTHKDEFENFVITIQRSDDIKRFSQYDQNTKSQMVLSDLWDIFLFYKKYADILEYLNISEEVVYDLAVDGYYTSQGVYIENGKVVDTYLNIKPISKEDNNAKVLVNTYNILYNRILPQTFQELLEMLGMQYLIEDKNQLSLDFEKPEATTTVPKTTPTGEEVESQIKITPINKSIPEYGNVYKVEVENLVNELTLLDELKLDGKINLKDLILLPDITEKNIPLIAKLCASPYFNKSKQGLETIELTDEALQNAAKRHSKILKYKQDKETGKVTITVPKSFIVGYTLEEIDMYYNHEALMNISSISPIKLKSFAKATMFLASDYITRILEQDSDVIDELNLTEEELKKCTSRIDVLNTIGLGRILNHIKEQFFDNHSGDLIDACQEISNNWNAFVELGFLELMQLEKIALNQQEVFQESNIALDIFDTADEQEIQEIFGSSVETWLVGFRLMSVFSGLSQMIKQRLHSLILSKLDEDGDLVPVLNELGMFESVDATMATASILKWTRYSTSLDLMIEKLKQHLNEALWLKPLILDLEETDDEQFKASFFTNFCKYFQSYVINFVDKDGVSKSKTINENEYADTVIQNLKIAFEQNRSNLFITSKPEGIYTAGIDKLYNAVNATTLQTLDIDKVINWLQIGFNIPFTGEKETLFTLLQEGHNWDNFKTHVLSILKNAQSAKKPTEYNPLNSSNLSDYKGILSILEQVIPTNIESVSYSDGKLHYSYVIPSYLNILCGKISGHLQGLYTDAKNENERYLMFLQDEFGQYSWFKNRKTGKWLNHWLQRLATDSKARETFKHIAVLTKDKVSYVDKNSAQYAASLIFQYFANGINSNKAYFRLPMMSNKPSEEYIQFFKTQVEEIPSILANTVFLQELERILGCKERANTILNPNSPNYHPECGIKAFDKNGLTFQFLEYLSVFLDSKQYKQVYDTLSEEIKPIYDSLKTSLDRYFSGKQLTDDETLQMIKDVETVIKYNMDIKLNNYMQSLVQTGLLVVDNGKYRMTDPALQRMDIFQTSDQIEKYLKEYFYNDVFATMLILQLTVTDKAFYKDDDDLQKRLALLHAPVMRGYVQVKDFSTGERVSDGTYRSIILKDDVIKSDILTNLHLARKLILSQISDPVIKQKTEMFLKDAISAFEAVNFADAQSFQTPTALRKKLHMFGKWTQEMEYAYNKIMSGAPYGEADVNVLWLPLKPFVYGMKLQNSYSSMGAIRSGVQFKNSEYTLILADAILRMANMPNKLQAIYDVLEATHHTKNADNTINMQERTTNGIDSCQFESTFKAGLTGIIDITEKGVATYIDKNSDKVKEIKKQLLELNPWLANNEMLLDSYLKTEVVKHILQDAIYNASNKTLSGYNTDYVQELPFDCYGLQQEVPSHFRHEQQMGSQMRALIIADTPNLNPVTGEKNYVVIDGKRISVKEAKAKYMSAIVNNINISRQEIEEELNLTSKNQQLKDLALSRLLRKTILEDGRYGADALWGVTINPETGTFNRPLSDPTQLDMIEKMLNSIVKNRIHKQKIAGGPCVQVTNFGTSDELHIRYKTADTFNEDGSIKEAGKLLFTEQEFNALKGLKRINRENAEKVISQRVARHLDDYVWDDKIQTYKQYVETFLYSPAYYECYAPIYADWLRDKQFLDKNGNIDVDKVAEANPKALQMIGYRIPTEAKYSMCPIKIVGFLPVTAGEGIMLPKELTTLSGSDKMRHCFYHYNIKNHINCWKL